jgi:hypothetical protein
MYKFDLKVRSVTVMDVSGLQIKVFFNSNHRKLEEEVSRWLTENSGAVIEHINQSSSQVGHCISLFYRSKF